MAEMKIAITGGAGCLGSNLIEYWLPRGHEILIIDNFSTGHREVLPSLANLKLVEGDIADRDLVLRSFESFRPTHVIHSAASYKDPLDWREDIGTNILGAINVVEAALDHKVQRFVNFQTALCYGRPTQLPIPVSHPTAPFTSYGISKTAGEAYILKSGLPTVSLRLANICGPRLAIGPIPTFYTRLKTGRSCFCTETVRDFLDMSDFFSLIDKVMSGKAPCGIFNVSTGKGYSIEDVFEAVASYLQMDVPDVPLLPAGDDDVPVVVLDPVETEKSFNWKAKISFADTICRQLKWYDAHGVSAIYSHLVNPKL